MVASTYVEDIATSRAFYELLGFREHSTGRAPTSGWSYMQLDGHWLLLASTRPPLAIPRLPLLFYFYFEDVDAVTSTLAAAGLEPVHMGHPPHALGGEVKITDPDGNTVLLGQLERSASQPSSAEEKASSWFSLLKESADLVAAKGGASVICQVRGTTAPVCQRTAEVKLVDTAGTTVWACLPHAEEILLTVHGAFIASQDDGGIAAFLGRDHG
jgi:catechol 2,3-dioxygenase-like lactoylglutathione lyase family enzyme